MDSTPRRRDHLDLITAGTPACYPRRAATTAAAHISHNVIKQGQKGAMEMLRIIVMLLVGGSRREQRRIIIAAMAPE